MKAIRLLMMSLLLVAGTAIALSAQEAKSDKVKTETVVYDVALHCENCKAKVEKNIPFEKGVKDVIVDLGAKTVTVKFDPAKNTAEGIRKAIEKLGYKAALRVAKEKK